MRSVLILLICIMMLFTFSACSMERYDSDIDSDETEEAEKAPKNRSNEDIPSDDKDMEDTEETILPKDMDKETDEEKEIEVYVNGQIITMESAEAVNGIPFGDPSEIIPAIGGECHWNEDEETVTVFYGDNGIALQAGNTIANLNGEAYQLTEAPYMKSGKLLVPLIDLGESLYCKVEWDRTQYYVLFEAKVYDAPASNQGEEIIAQPEKPVESNNSILVGVWSSSQGGLPYYNNVSGSVEEGASMGEFFAFSDDGYYKNYFNGTGFAAKGSGFYTGKYKVEGNTITFYDRKLTWSPAPGTKNSNEPIKNQPFDDETREFSVDLGPEGEATLRLQYYTMFVSYTKVDDAYPD